MRKWVHSIPCNIGAAFADWEDFCSSTEGVVVETSFVDEFVKLPRELERARKRLKEYVPDENELKSVHSSLFNGPRYCLRKVDAFGKAEDERNKCTLQFCASDYRTFLVTNGMNRDWARKAGLAEQFINPHQWAERWARQQARTGFFENSFGINVLISIHDNNGERLALFHERGGKTAVRAKSTVGSADEGLRRRSARQLYDEKSDLDPAPHLLKAAYRAVKEEIGLDEEFLEGSEPIILSVGRVKSLHQPAALIHWPLRATREELEHGFRLAQDHKYEFKRSHFVPLTRDSFIQFLLDQERIAPVESWVMAMTIFALGIGGTHKKKVFLSYSTKDKPIVRALCKSLHQEGFDVRLDAGEIRIGDSLEQKLSASINESVDCVVAVLSKNSVKSDWVKKEIQWAMAKEKTQKGFALLPIAIDTCDIPDFLKGKRIGGFETPYRRKFALQQLARAIRELRRPSRIQMR